MKFLILGIPALAVAKHVPSILDKPLDPLCVVYTVVERPIVISTCFPSSTVACIDGYTTTVSSSTCVDTTVTESSTITDSPAVTKSSAFHPHPPPPPPPATKTEEPCEYTTITTDILTTICPSPTIITHGTHTYTITEATTFTITDINTKYPIPSVPSQPTLVSTPGQVFPPGASSSNMAPPPVSPTSSGIVGPMPSAGLCGAQGNGNSCQDSGYGSCCGSDDTCGHDAAHCGNGCQQEFGYCTPISNDGTCGNGVTCTGSPFGTCCSQYGYCGNSTEFCGNGCQPELGTCDAAPTFSTVTLTDAPTVAPSSNAVDPAASTIVLASSIAVDPAASTTVLPSQVTDTSSSIMPSATTQFACAGDTGSYAPGSTPAAIGAAVLASIPGLSIDGPDTSRYQLGLLDDTIGTVIQAEINPNPLYTDEFAYYEVDETTFPPTTPLGSCFNFGYFYHVDSGLCATVSGITSYASPLFNNAQLTLQPCLCTSSGRPPIEQLFCNLFDDVPGGPGLNCLVFAGDEGDESVYGLNYGNPPFAGTLAFNDGVCISIEFDARGSLPNAGSSTIIGVPATSTQSALSAISSAAYVQFPTAIALSSVFNAVTSSPADFPTPITQILAPTSTLASLASVFPSDNVFTYYIIQTNSSSAAGLATFSIAALATSNAADLATPSDQVIVPTIINSIAALATSNAADLGTPSNQVVVPASTLALPRQQQSASLAL
ncbi:chitin recognition protein [Drepanopeziza brunnea f. sp. 'multigermtubi' MB_m1]|uniref:Chitin recognition protein n=1 Tax=Marssonina brunnea f. sp. multigermtubi (strain MB_m1) TaxID=1072389 RepID=K1WUM9_MARBU|nr:chitin recognition protein [Drepanopeziza brunnea f. sp. 'multigermtubi' MB_m1]EKD12333.1 chitin recognition protein [Drepanopeziza brunnea f. sp. 'multigermtubi' MB_m1]